MIIILLLTYIAILPISPSSPCFHSVAPF